MQQCQDLVIEKLEASTQKKGQKMRWKKKAVWMKKQKGCWR